jgi:hypothetical protein
VAEPVVNERKILKHNLKMRCRVIAWNRNWWRNLMRQYRTFKLQEMLEIFALLIRYSLLKTASDPWR